MKTSNIILTAIFVSILVWVFAVFMTAKAKMAEITGGLPVEEQEKIINNMVDNVLKLDSFNSIVIEGNGQVGIMQFDENNISQYRKEGSIINVENGTLYMNITEKDKGVILRAKNIKNILLKDKVHLNIHNLKTDTLKINTKNYSDISTNSLDVKFIKLKSEDKSEVHFTNINKKGTEAEFDIQDKSKVTINNTKGMTISVKKGADAKYKDY